MKKWLHEASVSSLSWKEFWKMWAPCGAGIKWQTGSFLWDRKFGFLDQIIEAFAFLWLLVLLQTKNPLLEFGSGLIICASVICATNRTKQGPQVSIANLRHWLEKNTELKGIISILSGLPPTLMPRDPKVQNETNLRPKVLAFFPFLIIYCSTDTVAGIVGSTDMLSWSCFLPTIGESTSVKYFPGNMLG